MLVEKLKDQWICSCGNWVGRQLTWCPECCEDRDADMVQEKEVTEGHFSPDPQD